MTTSEKMAAENWDLRRMLHHCGMTDAQIDAELAERRERREESEPQGEQHGLIPPTPSPLRRFGEQGYPPEMPPPAAAGGVDLDKLQALYDASTEGQWKWLGTHWGEARLAVHDPSSNSTVSGIGPVRYIASQFDFHKKGWDDAEFIAAAHNAFPALIAELRSLRQQVADKDEGADSLFSEHELCTDARLRTIIAELRSLRRLVAEKDAKIDHLGAAVICDNCERWDGDELPAWTLCCDCANELAVRHKAEVVELNRREKVYVGMLLNSTHIVDVGVGDAWAETKWTVAAIKAELQKGATEA